ncbi:MAG: hypothetical protein ACLUVC_06380 [Longibaculum sp.]
MVHFKNVFCKLPIITLTLLCLIACDSKPNVSNVNRQIGKSNHYSEEEINSAMDVIVQQFQSTNFNNCTLTDLGYDEETVAKQQAEWEKQYNVKQVIVILSNFKTGTLSKDNPLTSHTKYDNYNWIFAKKDNHWEIRDQGY